MNLTEGEGKPQDALLQQDRGAIAVLARGARKLRNAFADMQERQALRDQFDLWTRRGDIFAVLEALGIERGQIPLYVEGMPKAVRLLPAMMARLGLSPWRDPNLPPRQDLLRVCALCPSQGRCAQWLESGAATGYEAFCRNAPSFEAASSATRH